MAGYADLIQPDRRTLRFTPYGLAPGELRPDDAVAFQSAIIARAVLAGAVPETTRSEFGRLRDKHVRGTTDYGNFAEVCNQAIGLYEPALRLRFVQFYRGRDIPFADRDGTPSPLRSDDYDAVYQHVSATKGKHIQGPSARVWFNGTLDGLLRWARNEGLLRGQRARCVESIIKQQRNRINHGDGYRVETPITSAQEILDLGEFINHLWGMPTIGGRLYPAPVTREVLALGSGPSGTRRLAQAQWLSDAEGPALSWVLLRGVAGHEAMHFDSRHQTNAIPSEYLWGPGSASDALRWLDIHQPVPDEVDPVDQLLLVRHDRDRLYLPQRPEIAAVLPPSDRTGHWYLLLADHPLTAFACVRATANRDPGHNGTCGCATQPLADGDWRTVLGKIAELQHNLTIQPLPPDVRIVDEWRIPERFVLIEQTAI